MAHASSGYAGGNSVVTLPVTAKNASLLFGP